MNYSFYTHTHTLSLSHPTFAGKNLSILRLTSRERTLLFRESLSSFISPVSFRLSSLLNIVTRLEDLFLSCRGSRVFKALAFTTRGDSNTRVSPPVAVAHAPVHRMACQGLCLVSSSTFLHLFTDNHY